MNALAHFAATDASAWHNAAAVRALVASANPSDFHRARLIRVTGDSDSWLSDTDEGRRVLDALNVAHRRAVTGELGYDWNNLDWSADNARWLAERWIARFQEVPSASEALEAEFARREGREPRSERTMSAEERDEIRELACADLGRAA